MDLRSGNKIDVSFNTASMTDIVFLLLIFFMLTSSFITPSGLPVSLPSSKVSVIEVQKVSVTITKELEYYINDEPIVKESLEEKLKNKLTSAEGVVVLHIDKNVPTEELVYVAGIATSLKAKVSIATKPQGQPYVN